MSLSEASRPRAQKEGNASRKKAPERVREVLEALWEALEIRQGIPPEVSDVLVPREGGMGKQIVVWSSREEWEAVVDLDRTWRKLRLPSLRPVFPTVYLTGYKTGRVVVEFDTFSLSRERAIFSCYNSSDWARKKLENLKIFRPLLRLFGIEDLEEALEALLTLENGEVRRIGPYVLVKTTRLVALHKGKLFGDLVLDGKFLEGGRVALRYPSGVEVAFEPSGDFVQGWPVLKGLSILWEGEEFFYNGGGFPYWGEIPDDELVTKILRHALRAGVPKRSSPRMKALIEELKGSRSPLKALEDPRFLRKVHLRALSFF
jgi:hypothetical protein